LLTVFGRDDRIRDLVLLERTFDDLAIDVVVVHEQNRS
jgi:hypothetical protein